MAKFSAGDMVVLISGSMRMAVESTEGDDVSVVWCHEGRIGRDTFNDALLNKWEFRGGGDRDDRGDRGGFRGGDRGDRGGFGGDRGGHRGGGGGYRGGDRDRNDDGGGFGGKPGREDNRRGKTGWDGKPREKKYFRDDD